MYISKSKELEEKTRKISLFIRQKERIQYKNKVADWFEKVTDHYHGVTNYYNQITNYYPYDCFPNLFKNLDSLLEEALGLIETAIQRGYREFLDEYAVDIEATVKNLMRKVENDELIIKLNRALGRLYFYDEKRNRKELSSTTIDDFI